MCLALSMRPSPILVSCTRPERVRETRREAFAVVVAKLGFKPSFISRAGNKDVSRRPCDKDVALAGNPALLHQGFKALVWHDEAWLNKCIADPLGKP